MAGARKKWLIGGVVVAIVAGAYPLLRARGSTEKPPTFITSPVERGNVIGKVTATGTLSALVTVQVGTQVSGRLKELFVDYNSAVK